MNAKYSLTSILLAEALLPCFLEKCNRNLVPRRSLLIRCPRKVSLSDVTAHGDRAENAWGLGWCNRVLPFAISELRRELGRVSNFN